MDKLRVHKETKNERLQRLFKQYERENNNAPAGTRPVVDWAVSNGYLDLPAIDPRDVLAGQMADALRAETAIDAKTGRPYRVNHARRVMKNGEQLTFWANMDFAPREHMEKSFTQRREQVVSDCVQLRTDVDVYNDHNPNDRPIELELNFTDDVAERLVLADA